MALQAAGGGAEAEHVLNRLSGLRGAAGQAGQDPDPRLVVVSEADAERPGEPSYRVDLAHEALLRLDPAGRPYWKTLRDWVDSHRKQLEDRDLLEILAEQWQDAGKPRLGGLAFGRQLKDFRRTDAPSPRAAAFLRASRFRHRLLRFAGVLVLALSAGIGASYYSHVVRDLDFHLQLAWLALHTGRVFEPEMVTLEGGTFRMGCVNRKGCARDEFPVREVKVKTFRLGRYEVTFPEYTQYALSTGSPLPAHGGFGRGLRHVINVSWDDAVKYADWLSKPTGKRYRLPTEAEWEYAARAKTETLWSCGNEWADLKDHAWFWTNSGGTTHVVGEKNPNPWGLHDVHGNVREWVLDCRHSSYKGAPSDGSAWGKEGSGDCNQRMVRGGSWDNLSEVLRSAFRNWSNADNQADHFGFRLAQDL